jgi:hypothetical protein
MKVRPAATTPTAGDHAVLRILIAIELSKKSWIVGPHTVESQDQPVPIGCRGLESLARADRAATASSCP